MGRQTKRLTNRCKACGYQWYPRGHSLSPKCPECGSTQVTYAWCSVAVGFVIIFAVLFVVGSCRGSEPMSPVAAAVQKEEEYPARLTIRFVEPDGKEKFLPLTGQKAQSRVNEFTGEMLWALAGTPARRKLAKGDLLIEENGDVGTVWKITRVSGDKTCAVEKVPPKKD